MKFDTTLVGGGFAGLSCAYELAKAGLSVAVLERKSNVGVRPHTTGLFVKEAALKWDLPQHLIKPIRGIRFYSPSLKSIDLKSSDYFFLATDTSGILEWFSERAQSAGAKVLCQHEYKGAQKTSTGFLINNDIETNYLVGADGAISRVAKEFALGQNTQFLMGLEKEFVGVKNVEDDFLHCFFDTDLALGYIAWVIPGFNVTQVGLACIKKQAPRLDEFIQKISHIFDFREAKVVAQRGGLIPVGGPVKKIGTENVLLLGDAAGYVSPLTAGGIRTSLFMGQRAGRLIPDYLSGKGERPDHILQREMKSFYLKRGLRKMIEWPITGKIVDAAVQNPLFRKIAEQIFFHRVG